MSSEIVVLVPVFARPHRVTPLIASFHRSRPTRCSLLFIPSRDDYNEIEALDLADAPYLTYPWRRSRGDWAKKINYGYRNTTAPWILCAADDINFKPGWDRHLRKAMGTGKRVLGTNDLNPHSNPRGIYSPHPLVARTYADQCGTVDRRKTIVCEEYDHNYPDRELAATAIARDEWAYVEDAVLEHLHPAFTPSPTDDVYRIGAANAQRDYRLHLRRGRLWRKEKRIRERWESRS